jgi:tRNA(Ser,Leu) C12 N-acetylase TAN1
VTVDDWNVVASVRGQAFARARQLLGAVGRVSPTGYYNVFAMRVDDPHGCCDAIARLRDTEPDFDDTIGRVAPVTDMFEFNSDEEFEERSLEALRRFLPRLGGHSFHVRIHRRGRQELQHRQLEEQRLDARLLAELDAANAPGSISFDDPDVILDVETIRDRGGAALWTRADLSKYPFLRLD